MFDRLTERARTSLLLANKSAELRGDGWKDSNDLYLGLITGFQINPGVAKEVLRRLEVDTENLRERLEKSMEVAIPLDNWRTAYTAPQTPQTESIIVNSINEARGLDRGYVGTEHLLLGILKTASEDQGMPLVEQTLIANGITYEKAYQETRDFFKSINSS